MPEEVAVSNTKGLDPFRGKVYERSIFRADLKPKVKKQRKNPSSAPSIVDSVSAGHADDPISAELVDDPMSIELAVDPMSADLADQPVSADLADQPVSADHADDPISAERVDDLDPRTVKEENSSVRRSKRSTSRRYNYKDL